ncbi:uncharacterized protein LOC119094576 [Pollicipes pollicipes]|uniref:uncharacterized protein LOC119094576 n=1 Tax=Pollicipes pollicipes TaxID=41117 RepID=UPI0018851F92|nr:uncharacterized protein LOC119094576 [Pollicipes pollicipes]
MAAPALQMLPLLLLSLTVPPASPAALVNKQRQSPADTQSTSEADARIINYQGESYQDGYHFQFETTNGIKREEVGKIYSGPNNETGVLATEGRVHWTAPDGMRIEMHWHADENGFQPRGVHMRSNHWHPVPELPPVDEDYKLLRALRDDTLDLLRHSEPEDPEVKRLKKLLGPQKTKAERLRLSRQRLIERVRKLAPGTFEQEKTAERASFEADPNAVNLRETNAAAEPSKVDLEKKQEDQNKDGAGRPETAESPGVSESPEQRKATGDSETKRLESSGEPKKTTKEQNERRRMVKRVKIISNTSEEEQSGGVDSLDTSGIPKPPKTTTEERNGRMRMVKRVKIISNTSEEEQPGGVNSLGASGISKPPKTTAAPDVTPLKSSGRPKETKGGKEGGRMRMVKRVKIISNTSEEEQSGGVSLLRTLGVLKPPKTTTEEQNGRMRMVKRVKIISNTSEEEQPGGAGSLDTSGIPKPPKTTTEEQNGRMRMVKRVKIISNTPEEEQPGGAGSLDTSGIPKPSKTTTEEQNGRTRMVKRVKIISNTSEEEQPEGAGSLDTSGIPKPSKTTTEEQNGRMRMVKRVKIISNTSEEEQPEGAGSLDTSGIPKPSKTTADPKVTPLGSSGRPKGTKEGKEGGRMRMVKRVKVIQNASEQVKTAEGLSSEADSNPGKLREATGAEEVGKVGLRAKQEDQTSDGLEQPEAPTSPDISGSPKQPKAASADIDAKQLRLGLIPFTIIEGNKLRRTIRVRRKIMTL